MNLDRLFKVNLLYELCAESTNLKLNSVLKESMCIMGNAVSGFKQFI